MADVHRLPIPVSENWDWQRLGACRGANSAVFFHPDSERGSARVRSVCGGIRAGFEAD